MRRAGLHARACGTSGGSRANEQSRPYAARAMEDLPARTENGGGTSPSRKPARPSASAAAEFRRSARETYHSTRRRAAFRNWGRLVSPARSFGLGTLARRSDRHRARRAARRDGRSPRARLIGTVRIGSRLSRAVLCDGAPAEARAEGTQACARPGPAVSPWNCSSPTRIPTSRVSCARCRGSRSWTNRWQSCAPAVARLGCRGSRSSLGRGRYLLEARRDLALCVWSCRQCGGRSRSRLLTEQRLTLRARRGVGRRV
jgi:hypothetical protein